MQVVLIAAAHIDVLTTIFASTAGSPAHVKEKILKDIWLGLSHANGVIVYLLSNYLGCLKGGHSVGTLKKMGKILDKFRERVAKETLQILKTVQ